MKKLLGLKWRLLPLVVAAFILSVPLIQNIWNQHNISAATDSAQAKLSSSSNKILEGTPNRILIPSLSIDLPVVVQSYSPATKTWPVAAAAANYAKETPLINNTKGQSLIYGHNNRSVFGPLLNIEQGIEVFVFTDNNHVFKYSYTGSQDITPTKTQIITDMAKGPAGLKMMTCDGPYFEYRHLMSFKLLKAS